MASILRCLALAGILATAFLAPVATVEAATCQTFKYYQACGPTSEQDCQAACGACGMCLNVAQFNPCVYECRCSC